MAITKDDIKDVITEWSEEDLLTWQCKVEDAITTLAGILMEEENISEESRDAARKAYKLFYEKQS